MSAMSLLSIKGQRVARSPYHLLMGGLEGVCGELTSRPYAMLISIPISMFINNSYLS